MAPAILCAVLTVLSILFIDQPVARYFAAHHAARPLFQAMAAPSLLPLPIAAVILIAAAWRRPVNQLGLAAALATVAATAAKDELKFILGRPWPDTWLFHGIYNFHPFDTGFLYGGFPSGHTAYIAAPMCVLWRLAPRLRALWSGIVVVVMTGLVGANYHFVGDVIAGFFTGLAAAAGTLVLMRNV